eukprot:m.892186 g.892186  ORF g.892186 m.892186 type:complete len:344 (+) comp59971_c0_seq10:2424-3455(+)
MLLTRSQWGACCRWHGQQVGGAIADGAGDSDRHVRGRAHPVHSHHLARRTRHQHRGRGTIEAQIGEALAGDRDPLVKLAQESPAVVEHRHDRVELEVPGPVREDEQRMVHAHWIHRGSVVGVEHDQVGILRVSKRGRVDVKAGVDVRSKDVRINRTGNCRGRRPELSRRPKTATEHLRNENLVHHRGWAIRLQESAVRHAALQDERGVREGDAIGWRHRSPRERAHGRLQAEVRLCAPGTPWISSLVLRAPVVVLRGRDTQCVSKQCSGSHGPLHVRACAIVSAGPGLRHRWNLNALHHMARVAHAILNGEIVVGGCSAHLHEPLAGERGGLLHRVEIVDLIV